MEIVAVQLMGGCLLGCPPVDLGLDVGSHPVMPLRRMQPEPLPMARPCAKPTWLLCEVGQQCVAPWLATGSTVAMSLTQRKSKLAL
jgi:hypothetical protein